MKAFSTFFILLFLTIGTSFAQTQYPIFVEKGKSIEMVPDVNVYIISETQFENTLTTNELYKNCEKRIQLLKIKITQQDSIIKLHEAKEANFATTLEHTAQNLEKTTDELEQARKEEAKCNHKKKFLWGAVTLEAVIILILAL